MEDPGARTFCWAQKKNKNKKGAFNLSRKNINKQKCCTKKDGNHILISRPTDNSISSVRLQSTNAMTKNLFHVQLIPQEKIKIIEKKRNHADPITVTA